MQAIKAGNYVTWPLLTPKTVRKHFPESDKLQKGYMKQQCQNVRSTKIKIEPDDEPIPDLGTHVDISNNTTNPNSVKKKTTKKPKLKDLFIHIINADETMYTNQPGHFPAISSKGNKYIMVLVEIDGNYTNADLMKSKTEEAIIKAYLILWK
jgi:hypothetical protein